MAKTNIFKCKPPEVHFTVRDRVPYNKLLTNLACSSRTVEYWPSVVFVRTSLRLVRTATTSGQYSPARPSRSVSRRLIRCATPLRNCMTPCEKKLTGTLHILEKILSDDNAIPVRNVKLLSVNAVLTKMYLTCYTRDNAQLKKSL